MLSSTSLLRPLWPTSSSAVTATVPLLSSLSFPSMPLRTATVSFPLRVHATPQINGHETDLHTVLDLEPHIHKLKIAIIGFGNFGQFLAKNFISQGHTVLALSRSDHSVSARELGVRLFSDPDDLCREHPQVILLCTSFISAEQALRSLPLRRLKRDTLFVDVLSVKEFAKNLLLQVLPPDFDIICSHPMFGPESAKNSWSGLNFVYEKVRIGSEESRVSRCEQFLDMFASQGCNMVEMSCAEHDVHAAGLQFITHTVGRVLGTLKLESTPINTKGYESLLDLVDNTARDSFDLYYGLFLYNKNAMQMLERFDLAFEALRNQLFGQLHGAVSKQLFAKPHSTNINGTTTSQHIRMNQEASEPCSEKLKIGIVGFGNFGQFLAKTIARQGHQVIAYSRSDYSSEARELGLSGYFTYSDDFCEDHPDVILLCTSILSTEKVLKSLPLHRLKPNTLFVDVLSVKEFPRNLFLQHLPPDFDILCTHPMFGPESGKAGWNNLPFLYDKVRVGGRGSRCDQFLDVFAREGCRMVEMSCAEHDKYAAGSQFLTHTVGRVLEKLGLESTPINTKGYETLLNLVHNTAGDSFDLYYGLFMYNVNAMEQIQRLELAFESLKKQIFGRLHELLQKQLVDNSNSDNVDSVSWERPNPALLPKEKSTVSELVESSSSSRTVQVITNYN